MKRVFFLMLTTMTSIVAMSQSGDELAQLRKVFGQEKRELIRQFLDLQAADSVKFWPIYDEYSAERKSLADDRINIINDYALQYSNITSDQSAKLMDRYFKNESSILKLQEKYFKKVSKDVSPIKAAQFMQAEIYLQTQLRASVQDAIPFIGEFDKTKN